MLVVFNSNCDLLVDIYFMKDRDLMISNFFREVSGGQGKVQEKEGRGGEKDSEGGKQERKEIGNGL